LLRKTRTPRSLEPSTERVVEEHDQGPEIHRDMMSRKQNYVTARTPQEDANPKRRRGREIEWSVGYLRERILQRSVIPSRSVDGPGVEPRRIEHALKPFAVTGRVDRFQDGMLVHEELKGLGQERWLPLRRAHVDSAREVVGNTRRGKLLNEPQS